MTFRDAFDLPISGADAADAAGYDRYVAEFLSYGANLRELFAVADAAPGAALINAHAAVLNMAFEGAEGWAAAAPYLEKMRAATQRDDRENLFCAAVEAWARRDFHGALALLDDLTVRWPADLCAIKWGQYHAFNLGDQAALLRFGERTQIVHERTPYAHGMIAFALEQNHRLEEAEEEGYRAVEIAIDDAWAHHAVAHVYETHGRARDGARWLENCAHTWDRKGVFIREHNWWHAALFEIALGREDAALEIFDKHLWGEWPEFPQEQIGAVSLLWRLELRGCDVGERWRPVVEQARARIGEHVLPFHDLHYLIALIHAGSDAEAEALAQSMRAHGETLDGEAARVWRDSAAPAAESILAFNRGERDRAGALLQQVLPALHLVGGSHAQRNMFIETFNACADADGRAAR